MLDTVRMVETPEGVSLALRPAGPVPRALAWMADLLVRAIVYLAIAAVLGSLDSFGSGLVLLVVFGLEWFYPVLFEVFRGGATPGKALMRLRVVHDDGAPVGWSGAMIRNLLRAADFLPLLYGGGLLCMLIHPEFKRLGDLAAGTLVVHDDAVAAPAVRSEVAAVRPPVLLSVEQQRALLEFAARADLMPPARRAELAGLLEPLTGKQGESGALRLRGFAAWVAGAEGGS